MPKAEPHNLVRGRDQRGFTLIELLVVVLIIGILAAIAIPSFLNERDKANDSGAKTIARTAETAMETYAAQNNGSYSGASAPSLSSIEPTLLTSSTTQAFLAAVTAPNATDYTVVSSSPTSSDSFTVIRTADTIIRKCSGSGGGCTDGTW